MDTSNSERGRRRSRLSKDEVRELIKGIREGSEEALTGLVEGNLGFVAQIARRYAGQAMAHEDLVNEGTLGLIQAAYHFDPSRDIQFATYASWWIRKSMLQALSEHSHLVQLPWYFSKKLKDATDAERQLHRRLGRPPRREELAEFLGIRLTRLDNLLQLANREVSLAQPISAHANISLEDCLTDERESCNEDRVVQTDGLSRMRQAFPRLSRREQTVIALRYGLNGMPPMTLNEIGRRLCLSRERVRQIESRARQRMHTLITDPPTIHAGTKRPYPPTHARRRRRTKDESL